MKSSIQQSSKFGPVLGRAMVALAIGSTLVCAAAAPTYARDNDDRYGRHDEHRYERDHRGDRRDYRYRRDPYFYNAPVYAPAPVYRDYEPSLGVSLFFPLDHRR